ncbi:hypothetical protein RFI_32597 [Reticulomyxa filosa]|uniref:Uncharacterized protein n=1 Tax=Reticulomyxa filosa TaxID=46433 RepID=X6LVR1_RETFI|nr:hypothetical protein RFI_32597 [Reticulomyxa filosa]|eukprot:ETO04800.1 hypothetical protein RFI_32597 [Reticulomyxa filosa]
MCVFYYLATNQKKHTHTHTYQFDHKSSLADNFGYNDKRISTTKGLLDFNSFEYSVLCILYCCLAVETVLKDPELSDALFKFMQRTHCEENLEFTQGFFF